MSASSPARITRSHARALLLAKVVAASDEELMYMIQDRLNADLLTAVIVDDTSPNDNWEHPSLP